MIKKRTDIQAMRRVAIKLFFLLLIILGAAGIWFHNISATAIDPDEVVWVLDARFYEFRKNKDWHKFDLNSQNGLGSWSSENFRLLDQPQLGKYWYGWLLVSKNISPWTQSQTQFLYQQFSRMQLDTKSIRDEAQYSPIFKSILWLRSVGSVVSFVAILMWGLVLYLFTKDKVVALLASGFLVFHPILSLWYRLAVPNSLQILLTVSTLALIFYLLGQEEGLGQQKSQLVGQENKSRDKRYFWGWILAGMLAAASASIKLNGFFLLLSPIFVWMLEELRTQLLHQKTLKNMGILSIKVKSYFIFLAAFSLTIFWLEPELWNHPLSGLVTLFQLRLDQQHRFLRVFENYSVLETWWFLVVQFLRVTELIWMKVLLFISLLWGGKVLIVRSLISKRWFQLAALWLFILIVNSFYANVGFDRYAEWSLFVFSFLTGVGIADLVRLMKSRLCKKHTCKKLV